MFQYINLDFRLYALKPLQVLELGLCVSLFFYSSEHVTLNPLAQLEPLGQLPNLSVHLIISAVLTEKLEWTRTLEARWTSLVLEFGKQPGTRPTFAAQGSHSMTAASFFSSIWFPRHLDGATLMLPSLMALITELISNWIRELSDRAVTPWMIRH